MVASNGLESRADFTLQNGKYTIKEELGRGRFAITYLAQDKNGKDLVIKTLDEDKLHQQLTQAERDSLKTKFVNEGRRMERCKHPHVVPLLDTFMEGQLFCLAMEYIHGDTLESIVRVRKFLPEQEALGYIRQIGEALIEVHRQGLLHRDVKPENIIVRAGQQFVQPSSLQSGLRNGSSIPRRQRNEKFTLSPLKVAIVAVTLAALAGVVVGWQYPFLSSRPQVPPTEPNFSVNLNSEVEVDYSKLQNVLAQGKWKEADDETADVILKVGGREKEGWLDTASIKKLSCTDLRTIDNLWVKHSESRFGLSVQQRIWERVGGTPDDYRAYERFGDRVKWRVNSKWLGQNNSTFTTKAPEGHLPAKTLYNGGYMRKELPGFFSRVETCKV
ncbi:serine/threonine-protein kinase [Allocoleopsis franciscana]|uniref:Protein kinase family protein n=1 Tax=Allocoleopsis franciscana PCC 7113 TaxID=1173027 RepID=K9WF62_9CYAN|nr:serine/threonine-protein kinase [Allocoleopsis franciscana]AFZ18137.1 protein kinase family protein [Allocoleopsis franciscana PCC 7113]